MMDLERPEDDLRMRDAVRRANEVSVSKVLKDFFGIDVPDEGSSFKTYCPFGWQHADGGFEKNYRTYPDTNTTHCFAEHGLLNPVRLIQMQRDLSAVNAAAVVLERYGMLSPRSYKLRFAQMQVDREQREPDTGSPQVLASALLSRLAKHPKYAESELESWMLEAIDEELAKLETLPPEEPALRTWFTEASDRLVAVLDVERGRDDG